MHQCELCLNCYFPLYSTLKHGKINFSQAMSIYTITIIQHLVGNCNYTSVFPLKVQLTMDSLQLRPNKGQFCFLPLFCFPWSQELTQCLPV